MKTMKSHIHKVSLTIFQSYTHAIFHTSNITLFQSCTLPLFQSYTFLILHSSK